jgi:hypothetical protein
MQQFAPHTIRQAEQLVEREQGSAKTGGRFSSGMFNDIPVIPNNAIAYSNGYIPFDRKLEPCGGCELWSDTAIPSGNLNSSTLHKKSNKVLHHIGTDLYISDVYMTAYTKCYCISNRGLSDSVSIIEEQGDYAILFCKSTGLDGGIFKIDLTGDTVFYWKCNISIPIPRITDGTETPLTTFKYKYLYTAARIEGQDRFNAEIKLETGSNDIDNTLIDYGTQFSERPVGIQSLPEAGAPYLYEQLVGSALATPQKTPSTWSAITDGQFVAVIDDKSYPIAVDFSGVETMADVARLIQLAINGFNSSVTFVYDTDHFVMTNQVVGGTLGCAVVSTDGTDIAEMMNMTASGGGTVNLLPYYSSITASTLFVPTDPITGLPEKHVTHLPVYRTLDFGDDGVKKDNNEEEFILAEDVPAAKVFLAACIDLGGGYEPYRYRILLEPGTFQPGEVGSFEQGDVGAKLRFSDGVEVTITSVDIRYSNIAYADSDAGSTYRACAIGGDSSELPLNSKAIRVFSFTHSGTTIIRLTGDAFTADDVGKIIFMPKFQYLHVVGYTNANTLIVIESGTSPASGYYGALDPWCRNWTDTITDDILRGRITNYSLWQRYNMPLPDCDYGRIDAGFLQAAIIDGSNHYYQQIMAGKEYLVGYFNPRQFLPLKDAVVGVSVFPNRVVIYCKHSWYSIATNIFTTFAVNSSISILILYDIKWNEGIGTVRFKGLPQGGDWIFTNEPGVRTCDGQVMSDNLAKDRVVNILKTLSREVTIGYDPFNGIRIYGSDAAPGSSSVGGGYGLVPYGTGYYKDALYLNTPAVAATRCIAHAIQPEQGIGFYEVPATNMPMPLNAGAGVLEIYDDNGQSHSLVFDTAEQKWYDVSTRNGPVGTDMTKVWTGKDSTNFNRIVKFGEDRGTHEHEFLRLLQAMAYLRPYDQNNEGAAGYDSAGYPTDLTVKMNIYKDGKLLPSAIAANIPFDGVVKADTKVDAHRVQLELVANGGDHLIVNRHADYDDSKRAVEPNKRVSYELGLQKSLISLEIGLYPDFINGVLYDRISGAKISSKGVDVTGLVAVQGPEARKSCAIQFSSPLIIPEYVIENSMCYFWVKGTVAITWNGTPLTPTVIGTLGDWSFKSVEFDENGIAVFTPTGTAVLAHMRIYSRLLSDDEINYFFNDIVNNAGKIVLP